MDFLFRRASGAEFILPLNPKPITLEISGRSATYEVIDLGTLEIFRGKSPVRLSWEGILPGRAIAGHGYINNYQDPYAIADMLREICESNERVQLIVSETFLTIFVYVSRFKPVIGNGSTNIEYTIELVEARDLRIFTDAELGITGGVVPSPPVTGLGPSAGGAARPKEDAPLSVVTVEGDTLWLLAHRYLGDGSKWVTILNANLDTLHSVPEFVNRDYYNTADFKLPAGLTLRIPGGKMPPAPPRGGGRPITVID